MRKGLTLLFVLLALLPLLTWFSLPWTGQHLLREWLEQQGFTAPSLDLNRPSWERFHIDHLTVFREQDGQKTTLEAHNIQLRFDPLELLKGQLKELRVERAELSIQGSAPSAPDASVDLSRIRPDQWFAFAPSERLVIARLRLNMLQQDRLLWQAEGNLDLEPDYLQSRLALTHENEPLGYLDLGLSPLLEARLGFSQGAEPLYSGRFKLTPSAEGWQIDADQQLILSPALFSWLPVMGVSLPPEASALQGQIALSTQLKLPPTLPLQPEQLLAQTRARFDLDARLQASRATQFARASINLEAAGELREQQLNLARIEGLIEADQPLQQPVRMATKVSASAQVDLARQRLTLSGTLKDPLLPARLTFDGQAQLHDQAGKVLFELPTFAVKPLLATHAALLPTSLKPLRITRGEASLTGSLSVSPNQWQLKLQPALQKLDLNWDRTTRISALNLKASLSFDHRKRLSGSGRLEVGHMDSGLRIYGPELDFSLKGRFPGAIRLATSPFSLSVLDGVVAVPALAFDPFSPNINTRLAVAALDLQDILALYPQEGLYGSGVLGGELPVRVEDGQISIHNGQLLSSAEGGVIRYRPTPEVSLMGQQNPGIKLALDALTDLRFDLLDLTLDYAPDGEALFKARLRGHNPGWQQGRPIDLNLNIEENLLDLWRTLQLTEGITETIDRRFQH